MAESTKGASEFDEEEDVAEELEEEALWGVRGWVVICSLGEGGYAVGDVAGCGVHGFAL